MSSGLVCSNMSTTEISEDFLSSSKGQIQQTTCSKLVSAGVLKNLKSIKACVKRHLKGEVKLEGDYIWEVKNAIFKEDRDILKDCEECYLPDHMKMQMLGDVRHVSWNTSVTLMICEDGQVYAYDDQQLHLVAEGLTHLINEGITFPSKTVYHYGQAFEDMTEKEMKELMESEEMAKAQEKHKKKAEQWGPRIMKAFEEVQKLYEEPSLPSRKGGPGKRQGFTKQEGEEKKKMTEHEVK